MKYCPNCGTEINEGADVCLKCGKAIHGKLSSNTNPFASFGLGVGVFSLFINFGGLVGLIATILSAIGLKQTKENGENGKGMAIGGLVLGILGIAYGIYTITKLF